MGARRGTNPKTVRFEAGTWYDPERRQIHLTIPGHATFHTTVSNDPASVRYHPNLFAKLRGVLEEAGRWPG
jgi:hypothetical protein